VPKYSYRCSRCDEETYFYHSVSDKKEDCPSCNETKSLKKLPSRFSLSTQDRENKVGDIVKKSIDEFSADLNEEKEKLKNELWNEND
jgi:putative FmdB family regulatory protein